MDKRPWIVTIIGWLFIAIGIGAFAFHLNEVGLQNVLREGNGWVFLVELVAIACGIFVLRGHNWARWLTIIWIVSHLVFSFYNNLGSVMTHSLILLLFTGLLFRREANVFFTSRADEKENAP